MKLEHINSTDDVTKSIYVEKIQLSEDLDVPVPGDTIRTPKLEGKVTKVEEGYVYFTTADGRNMRNTIQNCTVVEKLADQECDMCGDMELDEVSTELLAKYKTAAGKDASAANKKAWNPETSDSDARSAIDRGNKRFSGIVRATKKQFDNDAKKRVTELTIPGVEDNFTADDIKRLEQLNDMPTLKAQAKELVKGKAARRMKPEKISWFYNAIDGKTNKMAIIKLMYDLLLAGEGNSVVGTRNSMRQNSYRDRFGEGTMSWINRSAPAQDVSYEKVLDRNPKSAHMRVVGEEQINELSVDKLKAYTDAAKSPASFKNRPLRKLAKTIQGVHGANDRIRVATGDRTRDEKSTRSNNEDVDSIYEDLKANFSDLLGKQYKEKEKVTKIDVKKLPSKNENFVIWYMPQTDKLKPVKWQVRNKANQEDPKSIRHNGVSSNDKDAFNDAEDWIAKSGETSAASNNVTINFNAAFAREVAPEGQTLWTTFWEGPIFLYSESPQEGYTRTVIRTPEHSRTAGAALLPVTGMSPKKANEIGLRTNSRYTLGPREELEPGVYGYTLQWHSRVEKGNPVPLKEPSITTSSKEEAVNELYQGPHLGDPDKLAKAPKSSMQGKGDIRFSELVQDAINTHGLKWAFDYYVNKHGLPPRQFQIFAGLTPKPKKVEPKKTDWTDPSTSNRTQSKPQSWWQKLRGKLPFEE